MAATMRAAINYLTPSGAVAISITERDGLCELHIGFDPDAVYFHWLPNERALAVSRQARRHAGERPDAAAMVGGLRQAAADHRVALTEHSVAVTRAADAVRRLDAFMTSLRGTGRLQEFNRAYRALSLS
jgi:hypothetical protein